MPQAPVRGRVVDPQPSAGIKREAERDVMSLEVAPERQDVVQENGVSQQAARGAVQVGRPPARHQVGMRSREVGHEFLVATARREAGGIQQGLWEMPQVRDVFRQPERRAVEGHGRQVVLENHQAVSRSCGGRRDGWSQQVPHA
jgi:hypothetical protein